jgi:hypothetical protein
MPQRIHATACPPLQTAFPGNRNEKDVSRLLPAVENVAKKVSLQLRDRNCVV